jgi:hypothetical protein
MKEAVQLTMKNVAQARELEEGVNPLGALVRQQEEGDPRGLLVWRRSMSMPTRSEDPCTIYILAPANKMVCVILL